MVLAIAACSGSTGRGLGTRVDASTPTPPTTGSLLCPPPAESGPAPAFIGMSRGHVRRCFGRPKTRGPTWRYLEPRRGCAEVRRHLTFVFESGVVTHAAVLWEPTGRICLDDEGRHP